MLDLHALTVITANTQTAGRGRFKRVWRSPPDVNIYATFCFFVPLDWMDMGHVPQLLALSAAKVLEFLDFRPSIKWPNDILLSSKKVAGILCETVATSNQRCVICGIGLNVNMSKEELEKIDRPATSLYAESGRHYQVKDVLRLVRDIFSQDLDRFSRSGFQAFFSEYEARSFLKPEQHVCFHDNQNVVEGIFYALNPDGSITLRLKNQKLKTFYAGEFF